MRRLIIIIKENWNDPVWSKVISAVIIAFFSVIFTSLYSLLTFLTSSTPINESLEYLLNVFSQNVSLNLGTLIIAALFYLMLSLNQLTSFFRGTYHKIFSRKGEDLDAGELPRATDYSTSLFHERMSSAFPGERGVTWFENPKVACDRLEILLSEPLTFKPDESEFESDPIWWFRGQSALFIDRFKRLGSKRVLMNIEELKVKRIASYRGVSYYKDFVYVEIEAERQTGLNNYSDEEIEEHTRERGFCREGYGLVKNWLGFTRPIKRTEYEDGAIVQRGKVKEARSAELRLRYLSNYNFIIAAKGSPYNSIRFQNESEEYLIKILSNEISPEEFFESLDEYSKNEARR